MRDLIYRDEALNEVAVGKDKNEIQGGILNLPSVKTYESTNCNECEMECPYREDGHPYYCPIAEGDTNDTL